MSSRIFGLPFPWEEPAAQELHRLLYQLYPTPQQATLIAAKAGVDLAMVRQEQAAALLWKDILDQAATGVLTENDRVELIHGEILDKMPKGDAHPAVVKRLLHLFSTRFSNAATVSVQDPLRLDDSEPEPDVMLLAPREDFYASGKPRATDVLLLIEVADSSLEFDRVVKGPMYARAEINDYWIVNLAAKTIEVRRGPRNDGYAELKTFSRGDSIAPLAFADVKLAVDEVLG